MNCKGRRVVWTDPDGGQEHNARIDSHDLEQETFYLSLQSGGYAEVPEHEVSFI